MDGTAPPGPGNSIEGNAPDRDHMTSLTVPESMAQHIGFAERWLGRARQEYQEGQAARGALTLLLAEAEVHHARELQLRVGSGAAAAERFRRLPALAAFGALMAVIALLASFMPQGGGTATVATGGAVIRFPRQVGSILALVSPADHGTRHAAAAAAPAATMRGRPMQADQVAVTTPRAQALPRAVRARPSPQARGRATAPPARVQPQPLLSDFDLIDLVLAAERSLRAGRP